MSAVLPTGYGKSALASIYNFMDFAGSPKDKKSTVIIISPLNALIRDQIVKIKEGGLNVSVLRGDRADREDGSGEVWHLTWCACWTHFDLIYTHPEVLVDNKKLSKLLNTPAFNQKVKANVLDEAHLGVDWYVSRLSFINLVLQWCYIALPRTTERLF